MDDVKPFTAKEREGALRKNSRRSTQMDAEIPGGVCNRPYRIASPTESW
jgi:hypothetical protein